MTAKVDDPTRFCVSLGARTVAEAREQACALSPEIGRVELRLDLLDPEESASGAWRDLPGRTGQEWVLTWRSPAEGGRSPRPAGVLEQGLESGFRWIDIEAVALENRDPEATRVPAEKRWVSGHGEAPPKSPEDLETGWSRIKQHPAALHKYVTVADRFEVNEWVLDLIDREHSLHPIAVFAQGWLGHPSRILGFLRGNAVTFVAEDENRATAEGQPTVARVLKEYALPRLSGSPDIYGVLGNPARHSRSPRLQNHAFRILEKHALYLPFESTTPEPVVEWLRQGRLSGISVTAPFKERLCDLVDRRGPEAENLGAVNTVWKQGDRLVGENTDLEAAFQLLKPHAQAKGSRLAVVGAGGAAAAVLGAAQKLQLQAVVFNRSPGRGQTRAKQFDAAWGGETSKLDPREFSVVANTTPATAENAITLSAETLAGTAILDLSYGSKATIWESAAKEAGVPFHGGLEFLARQAVGQIRFWTGQDLNWTRLTEGLES